MKSPSFLQEVKEKLNRAEEQFNLLAVQVQLESHKEVLDSKVVVSVYKGLDSFREMINMPELTDLMDQDRSALRLAKACCAQEAAKNGTISLFDAVEVLCEVVKDMFKEARQSLDKRYG